MVCGCKINIDFDQIERNNKEIIKSFDNHAKGIIKKIKKQYHITGIAFAGAGNYDKNGGWWNFKFKDGFDYKVEYENDESDDFFWVFNN